MKDKIGMLETKKKKYPICFNLNVMEEIQSKFGSISKWGDTVTNKEDPDGEPRIKELKEGLLLMINEAIDIENEDKAEEDKQEFVTTQQVGRIISEIGFTKTLNTIMSLSKESSDTGENGKNE